MDVRTRINEILADNRLDDDATDPTKAGVIETLIDEYGWDAVHDVMFDILRDDDQIEHWRTAAHVFWGAILAKRNLNADELIAWLYYRFDPAGENEDDSVWSITSKLKGIGYLSDYKPLRDPGVLKYFEEIQKRA